MLINKGFYELDHDELYLIYKARCDIFVVEQTCPYPEVDEFDKLCRHIALIENGELLAYCRLLPENSRFPEASVGRVLATRRRQGYASVVMREAVRVAFGEWGGASLILHAQTSVVAFYENFGFRVTSAEFLEDEIPHVEMRREGESYGK